MQKISCLLIVIVLLSELSAQKFSADLISDSLIVNAHAVKRYDEKIYEIKSPGRASLKERHVYTILNEEGIGYGIYKSYYDQFTSINYISGILYNEFGKEVKRIKTKDMQDVSVSDGFSLANDDRAKKNEFYSRTFPYTVEYEEEDEINGILDLSDWQPLSAPGLSVEYSKYIIVAPQNYLVRYKLYNGAPPPVITEKGDKKIYTWEIKNVPAKKNEIFSPYWRELVPYVMVAPSEFEAQGYKGDMTTWKSYGQYMYQLINGRDVLPEDIKRKAHELTDNLKSISEKIAVLYKFMQDNTRYISIQLGIGGWQPFDAKYVAEKKYGDCKALSNYTISLLKEVGIKAKYVEINSGNDKAPLVEDFPSNQFNHVVACVPLGKDTIWLECTDPTRSAGFMGSSTGNRKAILIDENGGHVVSTPRYASKDNLQIRKTIATINDKGDLSAELNTTYTGIQQQIPHALIYATSKKMRDEYLNSLFDLPTYQVEKSEYTEIKAILPTVNEYLLITASGYASITGKRLFIQPNIFNLSGAKISTDKPRQYDIVYREAFKDIDTIQIKIPDGYVPEAVPKNVIIDNQFGRYSISYVIKDNLIELVRFYERNPARYPAKDYPDFVKFYNDIYKADRARIVFVKKEG
ncbi:DUF3857 domain-containing protein [Foetidibacter luteolus]|uniref:DUF3857 domain-containing protein n=1 Tax=Foetidibacter luteolus TaxID=2608880 RepID=UPI001A98EAAF|nr:DUF3857 domain-containing protein [Foetidibacter luteolus]